jgi:hypothetical protein
MSAPAFTAMVRNRIHENAPDHSVETVTVGALRAAAEQMAELYEALKKTAGHLARLHTVSPGHFSNAASVAQTIAVARAALAKAEGRS